MNYAIVAFGVILLISGATWIFDGRKNYKGPIVEIQGVFDGTVEGMDIAGHSDSVREDHAEKN
jgi:hypothetical protein